MLKVLDQGLGLELDSIAPEKTVSLEWSATHDLLASETFGSGQLENSEAGSLGFEEK